MNNEKNRVNINKADSEKLSRIGGIGKGLAKELIRYREEHGGFRDIGEIRQVAGFDDVSAMKVMSHVFTGKS
jgi:competence protein ComEA